MPLTPKQETWLELFYPGLISAVRALGDGDEEAAEPAFRPRGKQGIGGVSLYLKRTIGQRLYIDINISLRLRDGATPPLPTTTTAMVLRDWTPTFYSMNYGPRLADCFWRCDFNATEGHHVHLKPNVKDHVPCDRVEPPTRNIDPRKFVELVQLHLSTNAYPLTRKL